MDKEKQIDQKLVKILSSPGTDNSLSLSKDKLLDKKLGREFKISNGVPFFLENPIIDSEASQGSFRKRSKNSKTTNIIKKAHSFLGPPNSTYNLGEKGLRKLIAQSKLSLNLGSSPKKIYLKTINLDIGPFENVNVVGDGNKLPFKSKSFDLVIIDNVLEHVETPEKIIQESFRVLRNKGKIHIIIPFVYVFHGSPNDFNRMTLPGLQERLSGAGFKVLEKGVYSGPSSTLSQMLRYYLATMFSAGNSTAFTLFLNLFGWLTFPVKYLDKFLIKNKKSHIMASVIYAIGEK